MEFISLLRENAMKTQASVVAAVVISCVLLSCQGLWAYAGGTGTPEDPYLIYTAEQMNSIGLYPEDWDKHFRLMEDIDLSAYAPNRFNLIGVYRAAQDPNERLEVPFSGVFDGQGHTIANFTYEVGGNEDPALGWVKGFGLFRLVGGPNAQIKDLTLLDPNLQPSSTCVHRVGTIGALAGVVKAGLITGCHVKGGHIWADGLAGGLVGWAEGSRIEGASPLLPTFSHCSTDCEVLRAPQRSFIEAEGADRSLHVYYGGMLGLNGNGGMISDCCATGPVSGGQVTGGLVGKNYGGITLCQAAGQVSGESHLGGLVGESSHGRISHCWASGDVIASNEEAPSGVSSSIGGLVGFSFKDAVSDCYASGRVVGQSSVGGLVGGCNESHVERCHATGLVFAGNQQAGGLVGSTGLDTVISECYARTWVCASWAGGGLVGLNGGTIRTSWADGVASGESGVGGLVGENWKWRKIFFGLPLEYSGVITDCYAMTNVICEGAKGGGLVGSIEGGTLLRCFAAGTVIGSQAAGGLVGTESQEYPSTVERSFWDMETTGLSRSAKGIGLSTQQMQDRTTYIDAGWDLTDETLNGRDDIWYMDPDVAMYPRLAWETEPNALPIGDVNEDPDGSFEGPYGVRVSPLLD